MVSRRGDRGTRSTILLATPGFITVIKGPAFCAGENAAVMKADVTRIRTVRHNFFFTVNPPFGVPETRM